ncbi:MAG TPA: proline racemase family protein [Stellaceae bacterium]
MRTNRVITVVGCHAEGEIGDVIVGGVLPPPGATMYEKMRAMERDNDDLRRLLLLEPRGKVSRNVNLVVPPTRPDCDAGVIIMEATEYVPMSGSNAMCTATVLLETGMVPMREPETVLTLDTPGGPVRVIAACRDGRVESVELTNVPSFADRLDAPLEVEGIGTIRVDVAYGGMFYAIADAEALGFGVTPDEARDLAATGEKIRLAARAQLPCAHPDNPGISGVTIVQIARPFNGPGVPTRNTCIMAPGRSDRSPTGTGTSARMAVLRARGQMRPGDTLIHESIIGSRFIGRILSDTTVGGGSRPAVVNSLKGRAWTTGLFQYFVDPADPFANGYLVSDTWGVTGTATQ